MGFFTRTSQIHTESYLQFIPKWLFFFIPRWWLWFKDRSWTGEKERVHSKRVPINQILGHKSHSFSFYKTNNLILKIGRQWWLIRGLGVYPHFLRTHLFIWVRELTNNLISESGYQDWIHSRAIFKIRAMFQYKTGCTWKWGQLL